MIPNWYTINYFSSSEKKKNENSRIIPLGSVVT